MQFPLANPPKAALDGTNVSIFVDVRKQKGKIV